MAVSPLLFQNAGKVYRQPGFLKDKTQLGLHGLSLELRSGEVFGLLGLNGSGKTTTMKLGLGLIRPTEGRVLLFGADPWERHSLAKVGYLPELPYFYPTMTPTEALRFYGGLSGLPAHGLADRIKATLARVGLAHAGARRMAGFSKGMLQRVGLGQALLHDPDLLILDEPVSGLDPLAIKENRDLFKSLKEEGKTLFLSSHSISEVEGLCDRVAILVTSRLARVVDSGEWKGRPGALEDIFVATVKEGAA